MLYINSAHNYLLPYDTRLLSSQICGSDIFRNSRFQCITVSKLTFWYIQTFYNWIGLLKSFSKGILQTKLNLKWKVYGNSEIAGFQFLTHPCEKFWICIESTKMRNLKTFFYVNVKFNCPSNFVIQNANFFCFLACYEFVSNFIALCELFSYIFVWFSPWPINQICMKFTTNAHCLIPSIKHKKSH